MYEYFAPPLLVSFVRQVSADKVNSKYARRIALKMLISQCFDTSDLIDIASSVPLPEVSCTTNAAFHQLQQEFEIGDTADSATQVQQFNCVNSKNTVDLDVDRLAFSSLMTIIFIEIAASTKYNTRLLQFNFKF